VFDRIGDVTGVLDLREDLPEIGPAVRLDENGDLFLDGVVSARVAEAFARRLDSVYLGTVERTRDARVRALSSATTEAHRVARATGASDARRLAIELGRLVSDVLPYPILAKFIPGVLLEALRQVGGRAPGPAAVPSPGARLSGALADLYLGCLDRGYTPERLAAEWPRVDEEVASSVGRFVSEHAGFGPVAWEAPGYETPGFVFDSMKTAFSGLDRGRLRARIAKPALPRPKDVPEEDRWAAELRGSLRSWAEFMEQEVLLVRGAFYSGVLPLLRALAEGEHRASDDLLFVGMDELAGRLPDAGEIARRKERYLSDRAYLSRHGIDAGRLRRLIEGAI
jgi:hypothetical protein